jgi:hypothetical protein
MSNGITIPTRSNKLAPYLKMSLRCAITLFNQSDATSAGFLDSPI